MNAKILLLLLQADFGEVVVEVRLGKRQNNQKRILGRRGRGGLFHFDCQFCFVSFRSLSAPAKSPVASSKVSKHRANMYEFLRTNFALKSFGIAAAAVVFRL